MTIRTRLHWRWHRTFRSHYRFEQGTTEFYICDRRWRWQRRRTEYSVMMNDNDPIVVTREQFIGLDRRLTAEAVASLDEAIALLETDDDETEENSSE